MSKVKFGVHLPVMGFNTRNPSKDQILSFAKKSEELGFDSLSVNDHIVFQTSWLDAISTLSAVASSTDRIKLATSVLNIVVRNPIICAKALVAIDILSSGRLVAGVGPGSHRGDYEACGIAFEERWSRFTEALEVLSLLMDSMSSSAKKRKDHGGRFYNFKGLSLEPDPFQVPRPPIHIGSWGSEAGLKRVAKYGDGWMASAYNITPDKFKEKWKILLAYRKGLGKDTESFENSIMTMFGYIDEDKTVVDRMIREILSPVLGRSPDELKSMLLFGSADECLRKINSLVEAGVKRIHFWPISDYLNQIAIFRQQVTTNV
jgi:alkanesulfonate monooxygenase SsuD/methylene tetrahydromethanopterin reductase-like flavin-dependent oxidoreductase (luciferase family)